MHASGKPSWKSINSHDVLEPFPNKLIKDIKYTHAILVQAACTDALAWLHDTIKYLVAALQASRKGNLTLAIFANKNKIKKKGKKKGKKSTP